MKSVRYLVAMAAMLAVVPNMSFAQEVCFKDANKKFENWKAENSGTLNDLAAKYEASADPYSELVDYNGMKIPIAAALIIEGQKYSQQADLKIHQVVGEAQDCSKKTGTARGVYDFAREILLITTILPEKATRIDFEELRRGNVAGGKNSVIRKTGRDIDKVVNPFRW